MVNINNVYQTVLVITNKDNRGYITPDEFNRLAEQAQNEIFASYFAKQASYELNAFVGVISVNNKVADRASHEEIKYINLSPLTYPVATQPVYTLGDTGVTVYPDTVTTGVKADYLKKPIRPKWGYVLQGTVPYYDPTVFDPATDSYDTAAKSYNFELHPSEENNLVIRILTYAGVVIKQGDVTGFSQSKEQQNAATEQ